MTDDSNVVETDDQVDIDLEAFEQEFYQKEDTPLVEDKIEDTEAENEEDSLATENEDEDKEPESKAEEPEDKEPPKKRNRAQERINQLLERERLANQRANELANRLAAIEAGKTETRPEQPTLRDNLPAGAPDPDAKDKDGNPVYALGEFDPLYIQDITKFTFKSELEAAQRKAYEEQERQAEMAYQQRLQAERDELQVNWQEKLDAAEEEHPEIRENLVEFVGSFQNLDPQYGEYLAATLMQLDNGPEVMLHLSQNIGEAQDIVAQGPYAATIALAKLDARFEKTASEGPKSNKKVSKAPAVPPSPTRGQRVNTEVPADTNDLSAFERVFYNKK